MAHLFRRASHGWTEVGIAGSGLGLAQVDGKAPTVSRETPAPPAAAVCRSASGMFAEEWFLIAAPGETVSVNGRSVRTGLVALRDRDEIRLASGAQLFFSTEHLAAVEPFAGADMPLRCPRCRRPIEAGTPVVRCPAPGCGIVHHETEDLPCWTYAERCAVCPQGTPLGTDRRWTPEEL